MTLVVSGGVIAAFAGPEAGHVVGGMFGGTSNDRFYYMGIFLVTGIFSIANLICVAVVPFQPVPRSDNDVTPTEDRTDTSAVTSKSIVTVNKYKRLLINRNFYTPMLRATMSWIIMVVPMSVLRIAMRDAGYTTKQSLRAMELHFCGMYAPGFVTGGIIQKYGVRVIAFVGFVVSSIAMSILITCKVNGDNDIDDRSSSAGALVQWMIGMFLSGVGWNFHFTSATVWLNQTVDRIMQQQACTKGQIQSANDFLMFLLSGVFVFGASFVYDAGTSNAIDINGNNNDTVVVSGWRTLNYYVIVFLVIDFMVVLLDYSQMKPKDPIINDISPAPANRVLQDDEQPV